MAIDLQQIGKRFRFYVNLKELEMDELKSMTGSDEKTLSNIISGQNYLLDELVAILKNFHDLNPQWLIYGEGSMFKPMNEDGSCHDNHKGCLKKDKAAYLKQMREMLIELEAAEVAKGHHPDVEALKAKLDQYKATH
ncbi:MAG: helix-turn-helix domain-containing protein [Hymenobacteraceae bacterium]|nr:helix-turn-helix domain-containing protein [Hymenobacteraceae bacterium]MDX5482863.1 helix-turn-helix domain-containing protein [Hymenobacteraceae bacterium]